MMVKMSVRVSVKMEGGFQNQGASFSDVTVVLHWLATCWRLEQYRWVTDHEMENKTPACEGGETEITNFA